LLDELIAINLGGFIFYYVINRIRGFKFLIGAFKIAVIKQTEI